MPGLDGTARLFKRFVATAPKHVSCLPIELPARSLTYEKLADEIAAELPDTGVIVVAESFSGPLAVALAQRITVTAFVFCNSFVKSPRARALGRLALPFLFKYPPPRFMLRRYLLGPGADEDLVREVSNAVTSVPAHVLASRLRAVLTVDEGMAFARCGVPTLYIRGMEDRLVPDSAWRHMSTLRPITTVHVAGPHLLLQANPNAAWQSITAFLGTVLSGDNCAGRVDPSQ